MVAHVVVRIPRIGFAPDHVTVGAEGCRLGKLEPGYCPQPKKRFNAFVRLEPGIGVLEGRKFTRDQLRTAAERAFFLGHGGDCRFVEPAECRRDVVCRDLAYSLSFTENFVSVSWCLPPTSSTKPETFTLCAFSQTTLCSSLARSFCPT